MTLGLARLKQELVVAQQGLEGTNIQLKLLDAQKDKITDDKVMFRKRVEDLEALITLVLGG